MPLTASQLATDMDLVSASLEAHDISPASFSTNSTLKTAALRLGAAFDAWLRAAGHGRPHQPDITEVQLTANNYGQGDGGFTYSG